MKRLLKNLNVIEISFDLDLIFYPEFFNDQIAASIKLDTKTGKWSSDNNSGSIINGPISDDAIIDQPLRDEWSEWISDCLLLVKEFGFTILTSYTSLDSRKSTYIDIIYGIGREAYGKIVFNIRLSDHSLENYDMPEEIKNQIIDTIDILDIIKSDKYPPYVDFSLKQVIVGKVKNDT